MRKRILQFIGCVAAVVACAHYLPGVHVADWHQALMAGAFLAIVYWILRPVARLLIAVFNFLTLGALGFIVDALLVLLAAEMIEGFAVDGFLWAAAVSIAVNVARGVLGGMAKKR